jgi:hypothetical protein
MDSPSLLGFRLGAMTGMTNEGELGADNAWFDCSEVVSEEARRGNEEVVEGLFALDVFTERFFVFRGFLFGESDRSNPARFGEGLEGKPARNMSSSELEVGAVKELTDDAGSSDLGESGEELGEDSVRVESTVEIVVVGEDSVESE